DYINKIANLIDQKSRREPRTPIKNKELLPNPNQASSRSINRYQRKISSILYTTVITKVDITFPVSRLSRFNTNPNDEHHQKTDRLIEYLVGTKYLALQLRGTDILEVVSNILFVNNSINRKSS